MKTCCSQPPTSNPALTLSLRQRMVRIANWIIPSVILAAMPKCPVCVAAYVALFTGCGISLAAAGAARWIIIAMSVATLGYLMFTAIYKKLRHE